MVVTMTILAPMLKLEPCFSRTIYSMKNQDLPAQKENSLPVHNHLKTYSSIHLQVVQLVVEVNWQLLVQHSLDHVHTHCCLLWF